MWWILLAASAAVWGQTYPGQSPYPAGGQYPQGQYPVPGISIPPIKLPKRGSNDDKSAEKANSTHDQLKLRALDGTLRELGEKDLYLEASGKRLFRFRLLEKTQFRNKDGETVRDSLLKPGDQLSVKVSEEDPETALRVVRSDTGSMSQREGAAKPFDHTLAKAPTLSDTHAAGTMDVPPAASKDVAPEPTLETKTEPPSAADKPAPLSTRAGPSASDDIVEAAREAVDKLTDMLPNFIVQQVTTRNYSNSLPARWKALDVVTAEVVVVGGQEEYRNILVNGKPSTRPIEKSGSWSTGEFVSALQDILSPYTAASFTKRGEDTIAGRRAYVYNYSVLKENSNWRIVAPDGTDALPAYSGSIWFDKETSNVLRVEERTGPMPATFPFDKAETSIDYDFVRIDAGTYLLPVQSSTLTCQRGTSNCTRNDIRFQNYRKFSAASSITFDK